MTTNISERLNNLENGFNVPGSDEDFYIKQFDFLLIKNNYEFTTF